MTRGLGIAVVCYPGLGGSGIVASELANGLAARGHRVTVLATARPARSAGDVAFERIDVPVSPVFEHGPYDIAVASHLVELARRQAIDVVHLHYAIPHAASALLAAQVLGAAAPAMVVTLHGTDVTRLGAHPELRPVTSFALAAAAGVTTPSRYLRGEAAACFGLAPERIEVISNFVDLARFGPPPRRDRRLAELFGDGDGDDGPILFHASNFRPIKRAPQLLDVLARVRAHVPARLVLVGDGPEHAAARARATELGVDGATRFLGWRDAFDDLLEHADGFVLASESESFGLAALEAMAAGVPVYGYRVGGLPEVVGDAGRLVASGDVDALAAAIVAAGPDRERLGRAGRTRAEQLFRSDAVVAQYEAYFRRLLGASRAVARGIR
ncbi:MAG: N-acetyl-alpha-D-glucosaminyl L-malate synthase BshA [Deltaproteobacteria bacterium]|nr:N-acetyl-alpha-D-glucosaminyl L-malate synthase BshA [Deltaproteobacteria bacterium]